MKFNPIPIALAFAALIPHATLAAPLRVVLVTSKWDPVTTQPNISPFRLGHAAGFPLPPPIESISGRIVIHPATEGKTHGCGGSRKAKMMALSNKFRGILGLPLIDTKMSNQPRAHRVEATPSPLSSFSAVRNKEIIDEMRAYRKMALESGSYEIINNEHGSGIDFYAPGTAPLKSTSLPNIRNERLTELEAEVHRMMIEDGIIQESTPSYPAFMERLQDSLDLLGTWEGRAVAFVLGCGLGVLIRMACMFVILFVRSIKGEQKEHITLGDEDYVVDDVIFVATPSDGHFVDYYLDEKVEGVRGTEVVIETAAMDPPAYTAPSTDKA